jgi:hypothetical protein
MDMSALAGGLDGGHCRRNGDTSPFLSLLLGLFLFDRPVVSNRTEHCSMFASCVPSTNSVPRFHGRSHQATGEPSRRLPKTCEMAGGFG